MSLDIHFGDRLFSAIEDKCPISVGIDPDINKIPKFLKEKYMEEFGNTKEGVVACILDFSLAIIDSVADIVPVVKVQMAFFEMYGASGYEAFEEVCRYAKEKGLIIIADGKKNDIANTAAAYSAGLIGKVPLFEGVEKEILVDSLTINPYLGSDGIYPFINDIKLHNTGAFCLVKTSNESSFEFQDLAVNEELVNEVVAGEVSRLGMDILGKSHYSSLGAVVGATYSDEIKYLRTLMPNQFFLVPGFGAQGGSIEDIKYCFNIDKNGALINSSRGILYAYKDKKFNDEDFDLAAREKVISMKKALEKVV